MTGLSILLFSLAGLLLIAAVAAIYLREYPNWKGRPRSDEREATLAPSPGRIRTVVAPPTQRVGASTAAAEFNIVSAGHGEAIRRRSYPGDVFRYTIRRPSAAVRRTMPDLGGFSEVPLRLYDQLGNRFTVHQKVRLN